MKTDNITVKVATPTFPVLGLLGVVFVTLKLMGYISWSWWWVTAPFWGPLALGFSALAIILLGVLAFTVLSHMGSKRKY